MVAHFFWADSPMSWLRSLTVTSLQRHNPDCEVKVHTFPANPEKAAWDTWEGLDCQGYTGPDHRDSLDVTWVEHPDEGLPAVQMADLTRWRVLRDEGGVALDTDIFFVNPLPEMGDALTCEKGIFSIGMLSAAGSPFFEDMAALAEANVTPERYQSAGVGPLYLLAYDIDVVRTNAWDISKDGLACLAAKGYVLDDIPSWWLHWYRPEELVRPKGGPRQDILGLHWSGGSETGQALSRDLTPENYTQLDGPLIDAIRGTL